MKNANENINGITNASEKNSESIISKIKKVLELSRNNPSEEEAKSAALKAQKLMAEYHISQQEIDAIEDFESIVETEVFVGNGNKWKYRLANIVANNFRCKTYTRNQNIFVFYGYEIDSQIAAETFSFLFETGNKSATSYYMKLRNQSIKKYGYFEGSGIKNCFLIGFSDAIEEGLAEQCTALMIVTPKEVIDSFEKKTQGWKVVRRKMSVKSYYAEQSFNQGKIVGRDTIAARKYAMA